MTAEEYRTLLTEQTPEKAFQAHLIDYATGLGWRCSHPLKMQRKNGRWVTATQGHVGFPDTVLARRGRVIFAELKTVAAKNRKDEGLDLDQTLWREAIEGHWKEDAERSPVEFYLWSPADWGEIERLLA